MVVMRNTLFWLDKLKERNHSKELGVNKRIILEWILGKKGVNMLNGLIWLRTGTSGGVL
jgi:hypothetical protein